MTDTQEALGVTAEPGKWWRVIAPDGSLWCETSIESEARAAMRPGDSLLREWVYPGRSEYREEHGWTPPTVKPSVEDVARAILKVTQAADVDPDYAWNVQYPEVQDELLDQARAVLALYPGRTETEVKAEAWDEGYDAHADDTGLSQMMRDMGEDNGNPYRKDTP